MLCVRNADATQQMFVEADEFYAAYHLPISSASAGRYKISLQECVSLLCVIRDHKHYSRESMLTF